MLQKDVHGLPKCVIENFDQLLMDERVLSCRLECIGPAWAGQRKGHRSACISRLQSCAYLRIAFRWAEAHHNVFRTKNDLEPRAHERRKIKRGQSPFANDDGVHEFNGNM